MPIPYISSPMQVRSEWIDYNGHMNMAYYNVLFDSASDEFYGEIGIGEQYAKTRRMTTYTAEFHICYLRELHEGAPVFVHSYLLDYDAKRFHVFQELYHEAGWLAATGETLALHIDMDGPKVAPMPEDIVAGMEGFKRKHGADVWPERAGRRIALPAR